MGVFVLGWKRRWVDGFRGASALLLAGVVAASTVAPLGAAAPGVIMIYGAPLAAPVFLRHGDAADMPRQANFWCGGVRGPVPTPARFEGRAYLKVAMFWGSESWMEPSMFARIAPTLRPERAHQHGRLYLPANDEPAILLSTEFVRFDPTAQPPAPILPPVPASPGQFAFSCLLDARDVARARSLGVAGL
jgi:hypothetical protein